jgi:ATP-binding cassette subfamily B protein
MKRDHQIKKIFSLIKCKVTILKKSHHLYTVRIMKWIISRHRVPVILQMNDTECGAACLSMILSFYGRSTKVSECRDLCDIGRNGVTARTIVKAAQKLGCRVKAYSLKPDNFKYLQLPAIIHWRFNHFVVIERWSKKYIDIIDPAIGKLRLTSDEFNESFTGVALEIIPSKEFKYHKTSNKLSWYKYFRKMLNIPDVFNSFRQILISSSLLQIFGLALPIFTKILVDQVLPFHITNVMAILGIGLVILVLSQTIISYLRAGLLVYLQGRIESHLMVDFFKHLLSLPFRFFQRRRSGDILERLGSNNVIREVLTNQTISSILDGSFVIVYLVILLILSPLFGSTVLIIGLFQVAVLVTSKRRIHFLSQRVLSAQAKSQSHLIDALKAIATLKASGSEEQSLQHWSNLFYKKLNISLRQKHFLAVIETIMNTLRTFSPLFLLWIGALLVLKGTISLGTMLALNALATSFLTPLASLVSNGQRFQLVGAHIERIDDVLAAKPEQQPNITLKIQEPSGHIVVKNLSFRYDKDSPLALDNISLNIAPSQRIILLGQTGAGKSTLMMLLLGLYNPTNGEILYDGIPLRQLKHRSLRKYFGVVMQNSTLLNTSIRQNIAFNNHSITLKQMKKLAKIACVHDEIMKMPMKYETIVGEGGGSLSGGQCQRLSIVRALACNPAVLFLDEATSDLDECTASKVDQNLRNLSCSQIVVSHRPSIIQNADLILFLDEGAVIEQWTHKEFLEKHKEHNSLIQKYLPKKSDN